MVWWQWLISLLFGLVGTAIGGYISYRTMLAQLKSQREIEHDRHIKQKREELYLKACDVLLEYHMYTRKKLPVPDDAIMRYNHLQSHIAVYASTNVFTKYYELAKLITTENISNDIILAEITHFMNIIKEELGVKDV